MTFKTTKNIFNIIIISSSTASSFLTSYFSINLTLRILILKAGSNYNNNLNV